jgi:type I restriction enzyme S subunit
MSELPSGWSKATVLDVANLHDDLRVPLNAKQRATMQGPYPYYGANGLVDHINDFRLDGHYVLLAEDGGYFDDPARGVAYEASGKFWVNNHAHILSPCDGVPVRFLRHLLNATDWMPYVGGTTRLKLTQAGLKQAAIALPPLEEQHHIVAKIDSLSGKAKRARDQLNHVPGLVERYKRSILSAAFRGVLTREWRATNPLRAVSSEELEKLRQKAWQEASQRGLFKSKYSAALAYDWLPDIEMPTGWHWASLDQVSFLVQYGTSAKTNEEPDGVAVLRMGNISDGEIDLSSLKYLPVGHKEFPELLLMSGDVLFNRTNSAELVGKSAVYKDEPIQASFASYLIRVRCSGLLPELLSGYINSDLGREWVASVVNQQVGQANVNGTKLRQLGIPVMPRQEQLEVARRIERAFGWIDRLAAEASSARKLIDHLDQAVLAKAFRGELVPQDPNDEPATALLERIKAERSRRSLLAPKPKKRKVSR